MNGKIRSIVDEGFPQDLPALTASNSSQITAHLLDYDRFENIEDKKTVALVGRITQVRTIASLILEIRVSDYHRS